jgi:hypothetical protein
MNLASYNLRLYINPGNYNRHFTKGKPMPNKPPKIGVRAMPAPLFSGFSKLFRALQIILTCIENESPSSSNHSMLIIIQTCILENFCHNNAGECWMFSLRMEVDMPKNVDLDIDPWELEKERRAKVENP